MATAPENPAVFDASVLDAMFGSETALITSVLKTFMGSTRDSLAELSQAFAAQDLTTVASVAHRVSGASRMSGAHALGHAARGVEQAAKLGDVTAAAHGLGILHAQWLLLLVAIASH
jgi:two-component system sensor histidine kinase EvgS